MHRKTRAGSAMPPALIPSTRPHGRQAAGAYREFEERAGMMIDRRGAKTQLVIDAVNQFPGDFTARELQRVVPDVSIDLIRRILRRLRQSGRLACTGHGPDARWRHLGTVRNN